MKQKNELTVHLYKVDIAKNDPRIQGYCKVCGPSCDVSDVSVQGMAFLPHDRRKVLACLNFPDLIFSRKSHS